MDTWGSVQLINYLRQIFIHQYLPRNATDKDIWFFIDEYKKGINNNTSLGLQLTYEPKEIRFVGPESQNREYNVNCISLFYDINRKIYDVAIG
jgi:hypothetical protein